MAKRKFEMADLKNEVDTLRKMYRGALVSDPYVGKKGTAGYMFIPEDPCEQYGVIREFDLKKGTFREHYFSVKPEGDWSKWEKIELLED